jgi:uncharacterized membrane protein
LHNISLYLFSFLFIAAGIFHFVKPKIYMKIMPAYLPLHKQLVYISGIAEIILGILLLPSVTRPVAAWGVVVLLIVVFPANIQMMQNYFHKNHPYKWITLVRLPLQILLIWWALQFK